MKKCIVATKTEADEPDKHELGKTIHIYNCSEKKLNLARWNNGL